MSPVGFCFSRDKQRPTKPIFLSWKDLIPFPKYNKIQESGSIFRVGFALSKTPHLHRAYLVTVRKRKSMTVYSTH